MYENSFDGIPRALDILSRIGSEDRVGDSLSPDTINLYARKIRQIASRVGCETPENLKPELVVRDLTDRVEKQQITRATARLEKSAALFWLAEQGQSVMDTGGQDFWRYESAYKDILLINTKQLSKRSDNTSSKKPKAFPDEAILLLQNAALTDKSALLKKILLLIRSNLYVGLRPVEWLNAKFFTYLHKDEQGIYRSNQHGKLETSPALEILNAKHSSIRGNGDSRIILLDALDDQQLLIVRKWLEVVEEMRNDLRQEKTEAATREMLFDPYQRIIRRVLKKSGWQGEIPTIYSTRHQAVANAKADGQTQTEIAALFGHSSVETAQRHYGKKISGYTGRSMRAAPESILAVRSTVTQEIATWPETTPEDEANLRKA